MTHEEIRVIREWLANATQTEYVIGCRGRIPALLDEIERLQAKLYETYAISNNAIYFSDSSDYLPALYDICQATRPDVDAEKLGESYIEEEAKEDTNNADD